VAEVAASSRTAAHVQADTVREDSGMAMCFRSRPSCLLHLHVHWESGNMSDGGRRVEGRAGSRCSYTAIIISATHRARGLPSYHQVLIL